MMSLNLRPATSLQPKIHFMHLDLKISGKELAFLSA